MSRPQQDFQAFLDLQKAAYGRSLPEKMAQIDTLWRATASGDAAQPLADLACLAHTLAGTAGTLGFRDVGLAAMALELLLTPSGPALTPAQRPALAQAVADLLKTMQDAPSPH